MIADQAKKQVLPNCNNEAVNATSEKDDLPDFSNLTISSTQLLKSDVNKRSYQKAENTNVSLDLLDDITEVINKEICCDKEDLIEDNKCISELDTSSMVELDPNFYLSIENEGVSRVLFVFSLNG